MGLSANAVLSEVIINEKLILAVLSNVKKGAEKSFNKVDIKPVIIKKILHYHVSFYYDKKVLHENLLPEQLIQTLEKLMGQYFKQGIFYTSDNDLQLLFNKKGEGKILKKAPTRFKVDTNHNRQKQYLIPEGSPCDFMKALGVMDETGSVFPKKYDKFRQLNKYLEFVDDSLIHLEDLDRITIVDFGCGKAYLTFALYYYLVKIKNKRVKIIGLDLKEDVIEFCNTTAQQLGYKDLLFKLGDIKDFNIEENVDMVVSLHACDKATDEAIAKAVHWQAKVIFAVPCCQHELFSQLNNKSMAPLLKYGVVKDKLTTIVTDTIRATALEAVGYDVQMLEFIEMEHTPKNILIRAYHQTKTKEALDDAFKVYKDFISVWQVNPHIDRILFPNDIL